MKNGYTLIEVVIIGILALTVIALLSSHTQTATENSAKFSEKSLRTQVSLYKIDHGNAPPTSLRLLTTKTNADHSTTGSPALGPYLDEIPTNPLTGRSSLTESDSATGPSADGGWTYDTDSGMLWADIVTR